MYMANTIPIPVPNTVVFFFFFVCITCPRSTLNKLKLSIRYTNIRNRLSFPPMVIAMLSILFLDSLNS